MNRTFLTILKYALFVYLFIGGLAVSSNFNTVNNEIIAPINYSNETHLYFQIWSAPEMLIYSGVCLLAYFITLDLVVSSNKNHGKFVEKITQAESSYLARLSNLDRKRWICEEHYRRENLNIRTLSDYTMQKLQNTPG